MEPSTDQFRSPPAWIGTAGLVLALIALAAVPLAMLGEAKRGLTVAVPLSLIGLLLSTSGASTRRGKAGMALALLSLLAAAGFYLWLLTQ